MTQQQIFQNMTKGEWKLEDSGLVSYYSVVTDADNDFDVLSVKKAHIKKANIEAITAAVNNTYGKGINPEGVEATNKGLSDLIKWVELTAMPILKTFGYDEEVLPKGFDKWKEALTAAKL
jgi:hypothetical protein